MPLSSQWQPGARPKFDYKLAWFDRFHKHAKKLLALKKPVILAGDYNVIPTELDVYKPSSWVDDALFFPESRAAYRKLVAQGWTDSLRELYPTEKIYTFWDYFRNAYARNAGLRIDHHIVESHNCGIDLLPPAWIVMSGAGRNQATMPRLGLN